MVEKATHPRRADCSPPERAFLQNDSVCAREPVARKTKTPLEAGLESRVDSFYITSHLVPGSMRGDYSERSCELGTAA